MAHILDKRKLEIEEIVRRIELDTGLSYPKNGLMEIADSLGLSVVEGELPDFNGRKVKGFIKWFAESEKVKNRGYVANIFLNSRQDSKVKNFTLAHEIGHFLLHKGDDNLRIDLQDYSKEGDPENHETEANYFAGALLMPEDKLLATIKNAKSLDEVADDFAVSVPAVESRLKWLGYVIK